FLCHLYRHELFSHRTLLILLLFFSSRSRPPRHLHSFPTRRSSDLPRAGPRAPRSLQRAARLPRSPPARGREGRRRLSRQLRARRSEEHTSELQSHLNLVCRLLLEKKKKRQNT